MSEEPIKTENEQKPEKRLILNRHTLWTIPNILTYIRILCVPIYMTLIILSSRPSYPDWYVFVALGVMIFAALTDVVDGKIARKYPGQGTYVGQCIDPVADKAMHIGAIVALAVAGYLHWAFIILIVFRELCMVVIGSFIVNDVNIKSNMLGKVASAIISCGIILCFFHNYIRELWGEFGFDWIVVTIGLTLNWAAAINYAVIYLPQSAAAKKAKAEEEKNTANTTDDKKDNN